MILQESERNSWYKIGIFSSKEEWNSFKIYLEFIGIKLIDWNETSGDPLSPDGWGLTKEEYEAALEFNKIYG